MGAGHGRSNRPYTSSSIMVNSREIQRQIGYQVPPVGDDRNQLAACLASISDIALTGETDGDQPTTRPLSRDQTERTGNGSGSAVSGGGRSLRLRLKQRLQRNRSSDGGEGVVCDTTTAGSGSLDDEVARNHRQLLDSLDSQDDDTTDWAAMRQWLVWCLHEQLGDTELELFSDRHSSSSSAGRRRILRQQNQLQQQYSSCSSQQNDQSLDNDDEGHLDNDVNTASSDRSPSAIVQLDSLSSAPSLLLQPPTAGTSLVVPLKTSILASNARLVRQHAVHERSPRASYSEGTDDFFDVGSIGLSRRHGRLQSSPASGRGQSMPPPRNRFGSDGLPHRSNVFIGSQDRVISATSKVTVRLESTGERLTVNEASYSGGSSFESYGSTG